jgi:hypothetical protein
MKRKNIRATRQRSRAMIRFTVPVTIQAASAKGPSRRFEIVAYTGGTLSLPKLFPHPVIVDLRGVTGIDRVLPILKDHQSHLLVGHTDRIHNDGRRMVATGVVSGAGPAAREVIDANDRGFPWQASIGGQVVKAEFVHPGTSVEVNGQRFEGPVIVARQFRLKEISFVVLGADEETSARIAASAAKGSPMTFEQWLEAHGFVTANLSDQAKTFLKAQYEAELKASSDADEVDETDSAEVDKTEDGTAEQTAVATGEIRAAALAESKRVHGITTLCGKFTGKVKAEKLAEIQASAISDAWTAEKTELELFKAQMPKAPSVIIRDDAVSSGVIEAAACLAGGLQNVEKLFDEKTLDAAHRKYRERISLQQMLLEAAWANGYAGSPFAIRSDLRGVLRAAFDLQAGFSTIDISGILSNTANKFMLAGFMGVEDTWRQIAARRPVNDFKAITSYRLTGDTEFVEVGPDGEIKHGTLGETSFTNQAKTYARMLGIGRQDIVNDDLGAISTAPRRLGRGSGLKFNSVFWAAFMNNAAFFTAARGNYFEGSATVLGINSLSTAEQMFFDQTDEEGKPLGVTPKILLVPNAINATASTLVNATEIRDTTASTKYPTSNPHAGKFTTARSAYLSNASITGYSTTAWYLLASPEDLPVIEACFLNGQESPTIETAEADFNTLGIQMRGYFDFGVAMQEYRGGVKSKGAA